MLVFFPLSLEDDLRENCIRRDRGRAFTLVLQCHVAMVAQEHAGGGMQYTGHKISSDIHCTRPNSEYSELYE